MSNKKVLKMPYKRVYRRINQIENEKITKTLKKNDLKSLFIVLGIVGTLLALLIIGIVTLFLVPRGV